MGKLNQHDHQLPHAKMIPEAVIQPTIGNKKQIAYLQISSRIHVHRFHNEIIDLDGSSTHDDHEMVKADVMLDEGLDWGFDDVP